MGKVQKLQEQKNDPENKENALENSNDLLKRNSGNCPVIQSRKMQREQ